MKKKKSVRIIDGKENLFGNDIATNDIATGDNRKHIKTAEYN